VYHFQYVDWPEADVPHRRGYTNICTLMQAVEKSQQNLGNGPIIVHEGCVLLISFLVLFFCVFTFHLLHVR